MLHKLLNKIKKEEVIKEVCEVDCNEQMFQQDFIHKQIHPKKKALAQMIFDGISEDEIVSQYGAIRLQEMKLIIHHARNGTEKVCNTCGT